MDTSTLGSALTFAVYFLVMVAIGLWVYRRTTSLSDFVLGGRKLNGWVAGLSANASDFSGWLLLGLPGAIYVSGLGEVWIPVGLAIGFYLSWRFLAPRLRVATEHVTDVRTGKASNSLTLSSYLENRFEDRTRLLRATSALFILVFYLFYVGSGLVATGVLFDQVFDMPAGTAIILGTSIIVVYTFLGGFLAVSFTDVIQSVMMWVALLVVPVLVTVAVGGFGSAVNGVGEKNAALFSLTGGAELVDGSWQSTETIGAIVIISGIAWGFGYFGQPHILARFMGIRSVAEIPRARALSVGWAVTAMLLAVLVGFAGLAYFDEPVADPESVFLALIQALSHPLVAGILLAAVLAAIMSTADSQLLVASSALTEDGYRAFVRRDASPSTLVWVGRGTVVVVAIAAGALALRSEQTVLELVGLAWAGFGAAFGPVLVCSVFWRGMNWVGALAGMVGGGVTALVYPQIDTIGLYAMVPAVLVSVVAIFVFNAFGPPPTQRMLADFDGVRGDTRDDAAPTASGSA